jgi:parvulin-like peptidyl-prolyl isomerase
LDPASQKPGDPDLQKKREASETEMKAEADKLRARAATGEDFAKLQQEAYDFAGYTQIKASNPRVDKARKDRIPPADASIFELKVGDVSQVFSGPSGFVVYKVDAIEDLPVASVHDEISRKLASDREKGQIETVQSSTNLDDAYFGTPAPAAPPTLRNPGEAAPAPAPAPGKP